MLREYATVMIGIVTLLVAGVAAYGVVNANNDVQTTQEPINIPDYSNELKSLDYTEELNSLNLQVQEIKNQLNTLQELKTDISQIQEKLNTLEEKSTVASANTSPSLFLDKSTYQIGETVKVTAIGVEPQTMINVQILDGDFVIVSKEAWSDSAGKVVYQLALANSLPSGAYSIRVVSGENTAMQPIMVTGSNPATTDSHSLTVQADKSIYNRGDLIEISGTGKPSTPVAAVLTGPSSQTFSTSSSVQSDGTYKVFFPTTSNTEKGKWYVTVTHMSQSIVVSLTVS